jgi:hypothetical protein
MELNCKDCGARCTAWTEVVVMSCGHWLCGDSWRKTVDRRGYCALCDNGEGEGLEQIMAAAGEEDPARHVQLTGATYGTVWKLRSLEWGVLEIMGPAGQETSLLTEKMGYIREERLRVTSVGARGIEEAHLLGRERGLNPVWAYAAGADKNWKLAYVEVNLAEVETVLAQARLDERLRGIRLKHMARTATRLIELALMEANYRPGGPGALKAEAHFRALEAGR